MRLQTNCITCNIQQVNKVVKMISISEKQKEEMMSSILKMLSNIDYSLCNPEVMKKTWDIICEYGKVTDPYLDIKKKYNQELLTIYPELKEHIIQSSDPFLTAIKMATIANVIDFSANDGVSIEDIQYQLLHADEKIITIDDSKALQKCLETAKTVLYIGDNCGEIVIDKLCIEILKDRYPCTVHYVVRHTPIINDVTMLDAKMVAMSSITNVIESEDSSLGLVLSKASEEFQKLFWQADVIIAKGQGNFEGLQNIKKENMFHLFMVKCEVMEQIVDVKNKSIVCIKKEK